MIGPGPEMIVTEQDPDMAVVVFVGGHVDRNKFDCSIPPLSNVGIRTGELDTTDPSQLAQKVADLCALKNTDSIRREAMIFVRNRRIFAARFRPASGWEGKFFTKTELGRSLNLANQLTDLTSN